MNKISAKIIADSVDNRGNRITTMVLTFPRFILAELNTHRMFSRNSASSRAIPFKKMVKMVEEDPFIPIAWQKDHKGMQGTEYFDLNEVITSEGHTRDQVTVEGWLEARDEAVRCSEHMNDCGLTKQLCNRLLEPFMWHTVILTATEFSNFFKLRCPQYQLNGLAKDYSRSKKDWLESMKFSSSMQEVGYPNSIIDWLHLNKGQSEIHMMELAECMWDTMNESTPDKLFPGQWHIPFGDTFDDEKIEALVNKLYPVQPSCLNWHQDRCDELKSKIATARCARVSYLNFEGKDDYEADVKLYDRLKDEGHCFDINTEILTEEGWKKFTEINDDSNIAAVNTSTGEFKGFEKPTRIINKDYSGKVYKYKSNNIDLFITEGHKLLGVPFYNSEYRKKSYEAIEIFEANKPTSNKSKFNTIGEAPMKMFSAPCPINIDLKDKNYQLGQLFGFIIGDGHIINNTKVSFHLKKPRKLLYLNKLIEDLSIADKQYQTKEESYKITLDIDASNYTDKNKNKIIPKNIPNIEYLYGLFDGLKNSDGSIKRNTWRYSTTSEKLKNRILELCPLVGLTIHENKEYEPDCINHNICYKLMIQTNNHILINDSRTPESRVIIEDYEGDVYCVEIPSNGIIVRRNGKVVITHNCSPFEHVAQCMTDNEYEYYGHNLAGNSIGSTPYLSEEGWCRNFRGFKQLREDIE